MVDVTKMTDEVFDRKLERLRKGMNGGFYVFLSGAALALCSIPLFSLPTFIAGCAIAASGMATSITFSNVAKPYEEDEGRRRWLRPTAGLRRMLEDDEPETPLPKTAPVFNPAAATVLENDMRSMAPLTFKKRMSAFARG
jgi:hypothetical protein